MPGNDDEFCAVFGKSIFEKYFLPDPCVASGSGKTEEGFAARERFESQQQDKYIQCSEEIQVVFILASTKSSDSEAQQTLT